MVTTALSPRWMTVILPLCVIITPCDVNVLFGGAERAPFCGCWWLPSCYYRLTCTPLPSFLAAALLVRFLLAWRLLPAAAALRKRRERHARRFALPQRHFFPAYCFLPHYSRGGLSSAYGGRGGTVKRHVRTVGGCWWRSDYLVICVNYGRRKTVPVEGDRTAVQEGGGVAYAPLALCLRTVSSRSRHASAAAYHELPAGDDGAGGRGVTRPVSADSPAVPYAFTATLSTLLALVWRETCNGGLASRGGGGRYGRRPSAFCLPLLLCRGSGKHAFARFM